MKKIGLSIAISAALGLSGCFGGSSSSSSSAADSTVSGTASKGIIISGLVSAYLFDVSGNPETTAIATAITGADGKYILTIPAVHKGKPLYIDISNNVASGDAATMKCDISGGCGTGIEFGDAYTLADDFSLGAVLPESGGEVSVNLTPFTTAAAKKALVDIVAVGGGSGVASLISNANSSVANTLNDILGGTTIASVNDIPVVDLTDPEAVAAAVAAGDTVDVKVAALSAAIVSAVQADDVALSIEEAITEFTDDLAENALVGNSSDDSVTDVAEILAEAELVLADVNTAAVEAGTDSEELTELTEEIETEQEAAVAETPDEEVDDEPSETADSPNLEKVKNFVEELRELGTTIDGSLVKNTAGESQGSVETILDNFDIQLDAADMASSTDADAAMEGLAKAVEAIVDVYDTNFNTEEDGLIDPVAGEYFTEEQIAVVVTVDSAGVATLTVASTLEVDVDGEIYAATANVAATVTDLTLVEDIEEDTVEGVESEVGTLTGSMDLNIAGTVTSGTIDLALVNGTVTASASAIIDNEDTVTTETSTSYSDSTDESISLDSFTFDLDITLAHNDTLPETVVVDDVAVTVDPMSFAGGLAFTFSNWTISEVSQFSNDWSTGVDVRDEHEVLTYGPGIVSFDLTGTFANSTESFDMAFSLDANASTVPDIVEVFDTDDGESDTGGETETLFTAITASLTFDAALAGVADAVTFSFEVERTGFDDVEASVGLSYPGRTITIEATADNLDTEDSALASLTLTNNDGVVMQVDGDESIENEDEEFTGTIKVNGDATTYAELAKVNGVDIIRYSDGSFVSAF